MRKMMSIAFVCLVAIGVMILLAKSILDSSTGKARKAAVATLEVKLDAIAQTHTEEVVPSEPMEATVSTKPPAPSREALRARWSSLFKTWQTRYEDQSFQDRWEIFESVLDCTRSGPLFLDNLEEDDWILLQEFLEENSDILQGIYELTQPGYPALPYIDLVRNEPLYALDRLVSGHLLLSSHEGNGRALHVDLRTLLHCSRMTFYSYPPESFMTDIPMVIDSASQNGAFDDAIWEETLYAIAEARQHDQFVEKCAARAQGIIDWYDQMPQGSGLTLRESPSLHVLMWGYRYGLTPKMNQDMVRFSDIMGELLELAPKPYYEITPALQTLTDTREVPEYDDLSFFDTTPTEVHLGGLVCEEFWNRAYTECLLDQMMLAIEIARYRHHNGVLPASLEDLKLESVLNVLTGETHQYRLLGEGYGLWFDAPIGEEDTIYGQIWPGRELRLAKDADIEEAVVNALEEERKAEQ